MNLTGLSAQMEQELALGNLLPIMEQFYTVQGEGEHTGKAAYFIRIGGCDVGCHWCDVKESWDASIHPLIPIADVVTKASTVPARTVVITGGEPLMYNLDKLTASLREKGLSVHLETSGSSALSGRFDWICLSPKKNMPPKAEFYEMADELKVIVHNRHDFVWATENGAKVKRNCRLYLQPEWSKRDEMMPIIVDFVMANPDWNISLQSHKYMNIP